MNRFFVVVALLLSACGPAAADEEIVGEAVDALGNGRLKRICREACGPYYGPNVQCSWRCDAPLCRLDATAVDPDCPCANEFVCWN